jgi:hypothetical protein
LDPGDKIGRTTGAAVSPEIGALELAAEGAATSNRTKHSVEESCRGRRDVSQRPCDSLRSTDEHSHSFSRPRNHCSAGLPSIAAICSPQFTLAIGCCRRSLGGPRPHPIAVTSSALGVHFQSHRSAASPKPGNARFTMSSGPTGVVFIPGGLAEEGVAAENLVQADAKDAKDAKVSDSVRNIRRSPSMNSNEYMVEYDSRFSCDFRLG